MSAINMLHKEIAGYRLTEHIGSGGMGDVYKAYHAVLGRTAAVKILHQKEHANRFRNEAYIQSGVNHPNIARLYESVLTGDFPCIIMEYVEGITLDSLLQKKGKLSNDEALHIITQITNALLYLHEKDILHRDIKPANVKLQPDGIIKMLDFGIAKTKYSPKFTQQGFLVGTTEYMSPEQFEQKVEKKSDLWSLGVLSYEMLTGYLPFEAGNPLTVRSKILKASFTDPAILVPEISTILQEVIEKTLRVNPIQRISAVELNRFLKGQSAKKTMSKMPSFTKLFSIPGFSSFQLSKLVSRNSILYLGVTALLIVLITLFVLNNSAETDSKVKGESTHEVPGNNKKIKINVPSVENAVIVLSDGTEKKAPHEISGKAGERVEFTVRANGYADKKITIEITDRRGSYDINLEKLNQ